LIDTATCGETESTLQYRWSRVGGRFQWLPHRGVFPGPDRSLPVAAQPDNALRRVRLFRARPAGSGTLWFMGKRAMTPADFRRVALSLDGVEEYSHAGLPAFRVGGRKFASLSSQAQGYGNLQLTPALQAEFVAESPDIFLPIAGGFGRMGHTHIRLGAVSEDVLTGALRTAWKLRTDMNAKTKRAGASRVGGPGGPPRTRGSAPPT
jgi:hypothetical protein